MPHREPAARAFGLPGVVQVGWSVSEAREAFCTSLAGVLRNPAPDREHKRDNALFVHEAEFYNIQL